MIQSYRQAGRQALLSLFILIFLTFCFSIKAHAEYADLTLDSWKYENGKVVLTGIHQFSGKRSHTLNQQNSGSVLRFLNTSLNISAFSRYYGVSSSNKRVTTSNGVIYTSNGVTIEYGIGKELRVQYGQNYDNLALYNDYPIKIIIEKNTSLSPSQFKKLKIYYAVDTRYTSSMSTNPTDVSDMIKHIKSCTGGSWQSDSSDHWKQCDTCGYIGSGRAVHTWTTTSNPTCTAAGSRRCTTCGRTETISALGHSWNSAWTTNGSNHWHVCTRCNATKDNAAHSWTTTKNATCTDAGTKKCTICGYTTSIAALGHAWDNNTWQKDSNNHWHKCTRCSATKDTAAHSWKYSNINAKTHDKTCTICSYKVSGEAHNFVNNKCACGRYNTVVVSFNLNKPTPENGDKLYADTVPSSIGPITYTYGDRYYDAKYNLVIPSLQDYTFNGWYTSASGGTKITQNTAVNNSNTHTLYAHWTAQPLNITELKGNNISVIEYNGQTESQYIKAHAPEGRLQYPYANIRANMTAKGNADQKYRYIWESKTPDGNWTALNLNGVSGNKLGLTIKNASRDINHSKVRLKVINNAGKSITSNEISITVYYLPTM